MPSLGFLQVHHTRRQPGAYTRDGHIFDVGSSMMFGIILQNCQELSINDCRYIIPGGSAGRYERDGYIFDVGSSMMFGMGQEGTTNLITRALAAVGRSMETVPDPTQIHYRLPKSEAHPEVSSAQGMRLVT